MNSADLLNAFKPALATIIGELQAVLRSARAGGPNQGLRPIKRWAEELRWQSRAFEELTSRFDEDTLLRQAIREAV